MARAIAEVSPSDDTNWWVYDFHNESIIMWPADGQKPSDDDVVVPMMTKLVEFAGVLDKKGCSPQLFRCFYAHEPRQWKCKNTNTHTQVVSRQMKVTM